MVMAFYGICNKVCTFGDFINISCPSQIKEIFNFINEEIVSYDDYISQTNQSKSTKGIYGVVERRQTFNIRNIKTVSGKYYKISYSCYLVHDDPTYIGIDTIGVYETDKEMSDYFSSIYIE